MNAGIGAKISIGWWSWKKLFKLFEVGKSKNGKMYSLDTPQIREAKCATLKGYSRYKAVHTFLGQEKQCSLSGIKTVSTTLSPYHSEIGDLLPLEGNVVKATSNSTYLQFITKQGDHYYRYSFNNQSASSDGRIHLKSALSYEDEVGYGQDLGTEKIIDFKMSTQVAYILSKTKDGRVRLKTLKNHSRRTRNDDAFSSKNISAFAQDGYSFYYAVGNNIYYGTNTFSNNDKLVARVGRPTEHINFLKVSTSRSDNWYNVELIVGTASRQGGRIYLLVPNRQKVAAIETKELRPIPTPGPRPRPTPIPRPIKYDYIPLKLDRAVTLNSPITQTLFAADTLLVRSEDGNIRSYALIKENNKVYSLKTVLTLNSQDNGQINVISNSRRNNFAYLQILKKTVINSEEEYYAANTYLYETKGLRAGLKKLNKKPAPHFGDNMRFLGAFYRTGQSVIDNYLTESDMIKCSNTNFSYKDDFDLMEKGEDYRTIDRGLDTYFNKFSLDPWKEFTQVFYNEMQKYHLCVAVSEKEVHHLNDTMQAMQETTPCHSTYSKAYCEIVTTLRTSLQGQDYHTIDQVFDANIKLCKTENGHEVIVGEIADSDRPDSLIDYTLWTPADEDPDVDNSSNYIASLTDKNGNTIGPIHAALFNNHSSSVDGYENVQTGKYIFNFDPLGLPRGAHYTINIGTAEKKMFHGTFSTAMPRIELNIESSSLFQTGTTPQGLPSYSDHLTTNILKGRSLVAMIDKVVEANTPAAAGILSAQVTFDYKEDSLNQDWKTIHLDEYRPGFNHDFLFNAIDQDQAVLFTFNEPKIYTVALKVTYKIDNEVVTRITFKSLDFRNFN
jgi:hypothetical protein